MRIFTLHSPLGETLQFRSLTGEETFSTLYDFRIEAISPNNAIAFNSLLGEPLSVEIELADGKRYLNAIVTQARALGRISDRYYLYELHASPLLAHTKRNPVFMPAFHTMTLGAAAQSIRWLHTRHSRSNNRRNHSHDHQPTLSAHHPSYGHEQ